MKNSTLLTLTSYIAFFMTGFFINIGGAVTNNLADDLGTTSAIIGYCFSAFMIGRLIGISSNGELLKKKWLNKGFYLRIVGILGIITIIGIAFSTSVLMFAICIFLAGIIIGAYYSTSNMILADIYDGKQKAFHISMINFLYSVGGVSSPFLAGLLLKKGFSWSTPYLIALGIFALMLLSTSKARYRDLYSTYTAPAKTAKKIKVGAPVWMTCAAIIAYIFAEYSITYWTPIYMREALGKDALFAGSVVSTYWIAVLIGRFIHSLLSTRIRPRIYILTAAALSMISILFLKSVSSDTMILVASFIAGLACAGLFPALYTFGTEQAEHIKRTVPTLMMLSAGIGSFSSMPAGSAVKSLIGIESIMYSPVIAIAVMAVLVITTRVKNGETT